MSDSDPRRPAPPPWLRPDTHAAMQTAYDQAVAVGRDPAAAVAAACAVLLARVAGPGLAQPAEEEARGAAAATPHAPASHAPPLETPPRRMDEAEVAEFVAALAYALRFDARGKPRKGGFDFTADLAAEWLAEQVIRSNFVVSRRRPGAPHRAG